MKVCFIGHRRISKNENLVSSLTNTIINLIDNGVKTFLFGSMSDFDELSLEIVTELKKTYSFIKRIYVRSNFQFIDKSYEEYLLTLYDDTYFPIKLANAGKYSYVERNFEMIDNSTYCVFYYDKNYALNLSLKSKRNSGTKTAYNYALKKKKIIINLFEQSNY